MGFGEIQVMTNYMQIMSMYATIAPPKRKEMSSSSISCEDVTVYYSFIDNFGQNNSSVMEEESHPFQVRRRSKPCQTMPSTVNSMALGVFDDPSLPQPNTIILNLTCPDYSSRMFRDQYYPDEVFDIKEAEFGRTKSLSFLQGVLNRNGTHNQRSGVASIVNWFKEMYVQSSHTTQLDEYVIQYSEREIFSITLEEYQIPTTHAKVAYDGLPRTFAGNEESYRRFTSKFGTHSIHEGIFGGIYARMSKKGDNANGSGDNGGNQHADRHATFNASMTTFGGRNVSDIVSWSETVFDKPALISIIKSPITMVMDPDRLDISKIKSFDKAIALQSVVNKIHSEIRSLEVYGNQNPLVEFVNYELMEEMKHVIPRVEIYNAVLKARLDNYDLDSYYFSCYTVNGNRQEFHIARGICLTFSCMNCKKIAMNVPSDTKYLTAYQEEQCNGKFFTFEIGAYKVEALFRNFTSITIY